MATNTPAQPPNFPTPQDNQTAADLIRQKVAQVYGEEPDASQELAESESAPQRSQHQQFMYDLGTSGKDLATIQTEWHNYYQGLSATEKHKVWQEFYSSQSAVTGQGQNPQAVSEHKQQAGSTTQRAKASAAKPKKVRDARSAKEVQAAVRDKVTAGGKLKAKHHFQSLLFGMGMGLVAVMIFLFGFFNEVVLAPFIQPSRATASTPLIVGQDSLPASATPAVIIPKINVEIPVDYNQTTIDEKTIERALDETGIVHYPTTVKPGQTGNAAFFGHSSNNIFNRGKFKFAFVLLHTLVPGDTFYLSYSGKMYVYKVIDRKVVEPHQVEVLGPVPGQPATATLITCDPPGTSLRRLVVIGQQISPDASGNDVAETPVAAPATTPASLVGNGPTLWGRFISTSLGKVVIGFMLLVAFLVTVRVANKHLR